ncbi:MAG: hypothetical protein ABSF29_12595 [Tepidisphaeraceae bacterium]
MRFLHWTILPALLLAACTARPAAVSAPPPSPPAPADPTIKIIPAPSSQYTAAQAKISQVIFVTMYTFDMPRGTVSGDEKFWKPVDETALDVATYDRLLRNGLRVGRAPLWAWPGMAKKVDREVVSYRIDRFTTFSGGDSLYVNMAPPMDDELLFTLDRHGATGRWYDNCQNRFDFSFRWEKHLDDTLRVNVCPLITVHRQRWDYFLSDDPIERRLVQDEYLWDLAIRMDLTADQFLVVAPSADADDPYRVGYQFLTHDGPAYRTEQLMVLARTPVPINHAHAATVPSADPQN